MLSIRESSDMSIICIVPISAVLIVSALTLAFASTIKTYFASQKHEHNRGGQRSRIDKGIRKHESNSSCV